MKVLQYSQDPKLYWTALPALLAAAAGMTFEQFLNTQQREKHRLLETLFKRANLQNGEGARTFAAVLAHAMLELHCHMEIDPTTSFNNSKAILEEAAMIIEEIVSEATATPVEGPKHVPEEGPSA